MPVPEDPGSAAPTRAEDSTGVTPLQPHEAEEFRATLDPARLGQITLADLKALPCWKPAKATGDLLSRAASPEAPAHGASASSSDDTMASQRVPVPKARFMEAE